MIGNSTVSLESVFDKLAAQGIFDPRTAPSGFGDNLALKCANNVIADLITERMNWRWNSFSGNPFLTNSWQQDYPQLAQSSPFEWGERAVLVDINNSALPKPLWNIGFRRDLSRTSVSVWRPGFLCWKYNYQLELGTWPGPNVTYSPLLGPQAPATQNPIMSMLDKNGNILIVTGFGVTGATAPFLPANSIEGATVDDGTVVWTCVSPNSQGFRTDKLPSATGPTYQVTPILQWEPPRFIDYAQLLNPIPDSSSRYFETGLEAQCLMNSPNPADVKRGDMRWQMWLKSLIDIRKQATKEQDIYGLVPLTSVVERRWDEVGPYTADMPY